MIKFWLIALVVFAAVEAITVGLTSIWFALGSLVALFAAMLGAQLWLQIALFVVVSGITLAFTRPLAVKYLNNRRQATNADRVLEMACAGGAGAMGLHDADDIAPGKLADLVVIDLHRPNMQPLNNIARNIVYSGSKENVRMTMVNGRILYENGVFFIGEAPEEIYEKANRLMEKVRA